eukprot:Plantae.Rhodophyta-Hildenbrandia_rubra.ctg1521.p3 GENE.Plantae.Rhodophyta-Hildenbrandia_rubra.ctg1521~~Plantae.Rhodophyta-Hildenbrandia_rubra.ctg1521.p3  ORF type:complete len:368 (-),score=74.14 Plantae.Rhodophyta-Hildenbrandia_rubra.ctg1521:4390-5493(-)
MQAFTAPLTLSHRSHQASSVCSSRAYATNKLDSSVAEHRWRCNVESNGASPGDDDVSRGVASSAEIRARLQSIREDREQKFDRTQDSLRAMSEEIGKIMDTVRQQAGMPPLERKKDVVEDESGESAQKGKDKQVTSVEEDGPETIRVGVDGGTGEDENIDYDDEPYSNPKNFGYESLGGWELLSPGADLPASEGEVKFRIECDLNGCSLIVQRDGEPAGPGVRERFVVSGKGFRVGYDPESPKSFSGMVGNDQWLLALSKDETRHFKRLMLALENKMKRIDEGKEDPPVRKPAVRRGGDGMFNERVRRTGGDLSIELESKLLWVQAFGTPDSYGIRTIFMEKRQSEGYWPPEVVPGMLRAIRKLQIS